MTDSLHDWLMKKIAGKELLSREAWISSKPEAEREPLVVAGLIGSPESFLLAKPS